MVKYIKGGKAVFNDKSDRSLTEGNEYEMLNYMVFAHNGDPCILVKNDNGRAMYYQAKRFLSPEDYRINIIKEIING